MSHSVPSIGYQSRREAIERMAPRYREASLAQRVLLLDTVVAVTGYARKYAIRLLNQASLGQHTIQRRRLPRYGSEVQQALVEAWKASRYICAQRLIPFLPTLMTSLERHGHLHLTEESRSQLLSMSSRTAERVLSTQHKPIVRGLPPRSQETCSSTRSSFAPFRTGMRTSRVFWRRIWSLMEAGIRREASCIP
jgi:hypothetical protein